MDIYQIMALGAGIIITSSTIPQLVKSYKTKQVKDLSLPMFFLFLLGQGIWLIYGFHLNDKPIIISNFLSMSVVIGNIGLILKYRQ